MTDAALRSFCLEVATKAAKNTSSSVGELLHRTKARAYLLGALRRRFPDQPAEQLHAVITALKLSISVDDPNHDYSASHQRRPTPGREESTAPVWASRVAQLVELVDVPLEAGSLLARAQERLGWQRNFSIQTLAAAELAGLLEWSSSSGAWWLPEQQAQQPEETMTTMNTESPATETSSPAPAAPPPAEPTETREERKRRKKREWLQRQRAAKRADASTKPKPRPPTPAAPAAPAPLPAAASLDAVLEARVRDLVRAEIRAELAKTLGELVGKVLAA